MTPTPLPNMPSAGLLETLCPFRPVPGCPEILARQASDVFALWLAWEEECGRECPVPHWGVVWPAARVLARYLLDHREIAKDKTVLEIGCGGGVAAIAAKMSGARAVTANDIDSVALVVARQNAAANQADLVFDTQNRIQTGSSDGMELLLLADFFYVKSDSGTLTDLLQAWKKQVLIIIIADGGRAFVPTGCDQVLHEAWLDVDPDLEGKARRCVRILRF